MKLIGICRSCFDKEFQMFGKSISGQIRMFFLMQTFASDFIDLRQKSPLFSKIISTFVPTTENHE